MKLLQREISPIHRKHPDKWKKGQQFANQTRFWQNQRYSDPQISFSETLNWSQIEQRISAVSKTIVFLFTQQVDLLESIESNLHNYEKYRKTILILKQLVNGICSGKHQFQIEMLKTQEKMDIMHNQIQYLKATVSQLENECLRKDGEIQRNKQTIIKLTQAYHEAKKCYEQQLEDLQSKSQEFRINIKPSKEEERQKRRKKSKDINENSKPLRGKRRESQAYTDRSMYIRFNSSNNQIEEKKLQRSNSQEKLQISHYLFKIQQLEFDKQALERKLSILEKEFKNLASDCKQKSQKESQRTEFLMSQSQKLKQQVLQHKKKMQSKNLIIEQLLRMVQGQP